MANLVLCDAGVTARLPVDAVRLLCLGGSAAETGTHKLLAGVAAHSARLDVAVLHSLLLRRELGVGGRRIRHSGSFRRDDAAWIMRENDCEAVAEFIRIKGITRCPTARVLPTQGLVAAADGSRWKTTRSLATCRGEHEPLLAGEDCGMSTLHGRGR